MAAVDLTHIIYRAHKDGDTTDPKNIPNPNGGTGGVSLAGCKFRAFGQDNEEE